MIFKIRKDGGPESNATGYWLCEFKSLFSVVLMKFEGKSREAFHSHAFNSWNWLLSGVLREETRVTEITSEHRWYTPCILPIYVPRERLHRVSSDDTSWVIAFRGPWSKSWKEFRQGKEVTLTSGRVEV